MPSSPLRSKTLLAAVALAAALPGTASATPAYVQNGTECTLAAVPGVGQAAALLDPLGYRFDTSSNLPLLNFLLPPHYATLADGGSSTTINGRLIRDAYDDWGDLYVGASQSRSTQYLDGDLLGCDREISGRQVAFAKTSIGGLQVQRKLFVSAAAGSGARLVQSVTNPGTTAVTTSVFVGDLTNASAKGTLGSDGDTTVHLTSSGDASISTADHWAVTSDDGEERDPAIAHVWDGPGAATTATVARIGSQSGVKTLDGTSDLDSDQFGYGWQNVTIPAGATASFLSWEALRADADAAEQVGLAEDAATDLSAAPAGTIYEGMSAADIAAVRNWAKPMPTVAITPVTAASTDADVSLSTSTIDFSDAALPQCEAGTLHWDFGDGASATAPSGSHRFAAGEAEVTVTARNACGGTKTAQVRFTVSAPALRIESNAGESEPVQITGGESTPVETPAASAPAPVTVPAGPAAPQQPTTQARPAPFTLTAPDKITASHVAKKGVATAVVSTVPGALRIVLSGGGLKLAKTMTLTPGEPRTPTFKLSPRDAANARRAKSLQLRAKLTLAGGEEVIISRTITLGK